jgi:hypothetical protein
VAVTSAANAAISASELRVRLGGVRAHGRERIGLRDMRDELVDVVVNERLLVGVEPAVDVADCQQQIDDRDDTCVRRWLHSTSVHGRGIVAPW